MAKQLEAVYEHGVLRPLEPLQLAGHQHVRLILDERTTPLSWQPAEPVNDRQAEMNWLATESAPSAGQWVTLDGSRLVAQGSTLAAVSEAAKAAGVDEPLFAHVPVDDLPSAGW